MCIHMNTFVREASNSQSKSVDEVRAAFADSGVSIAEWARVNGFSSGLVYQVLEGRRICMRGQSYRIAVALGLKGGMPLDVAALSQLLCSDAHRVNTNQEAEM